MKCILTASILALIIGATGGCAKKDIVIGNAGPDVEIKKCIKLSQGKDYEDAIQCLEMFKARYPQSREGQEAELMIQQTMQMPQQLRREASAQREAASQAEMNRLPVSAKGL